MALQIKKKNYFKHLKQNQLIIYKPRYGSVVSLNEEESMVKKNVRVYIHIT